MHLAVIRCLNLQPDHDSISYEKGYLIVRFCILIMSGFFAAYKVIELLTLAWLIQFFQTEFSQIAFCFCFFHFWVCLIISLMVDLKWVSVLFNCCPANKNQICTSHEYAIWSNIKWKKNAQWLWVKLYFVYILFTTTKNNSN